MSLADNSCVTEPTSVKVLRATWGKKQVKSAWTMLERGVGSGCALESSRRGYVLGWAAVDGERGRGQCV